ncbi:MAG: RDD family protein [Acidobacteria bacterium]|nr:MAG: RDD family protein [Acidobacteriota bacterium]
MRSKVNGLVIQTPEGVSFSLLLASPVIRFMAWLIDLFCILVLMNIVGMLANTMVVLSPQGAQVFQILVGFAISIGYAIFLEWLWQGQTLGKRLFRLRVIDEAGLKLSFSQVVMRNFLRLVDMLPALYAVGGAAAVLSKKSQRLGDIAAGTIVIRNPKIAKPDLERVLSRKYNSLRSYPHLAARLRQRINPSEAALGLQALLRKNSLEDQARLTLFEELELFYRQKVTFPVEASLGMSPESYVRNVVDILFRPETK